MTMPRTRTLEDTRYRTVQVAPRNPMLLVDEAQGTAFHTTHPTSAAWGCHVRYSWNCNRRWPWSSAPRQQSLGAAEATRKWSWRCCGQTDGRETHQAARRSPIRHGQPSLARGRCSHHESMRPTSPQNHQAQPRAMPRAVSRTPSAQRWKIGHMGSPRAGRASSTSTARGLASQRRAP